MPSKLEFVVDYFSAQGNVYYIAGLCNIGSISLGSIFLQVHKNIIGKDAEGFPIVKSKKFLRNIELKVTKIRSYNRDLEELPQGMTGELWLEGKEGFQIHPKELITNE